MIAKILCWFRGGHDWTPTEFDVKETYGYSSILVTAWRCDCCKATRKALKVTQ